VRFFFNIVGILLKRFGHFNNIYVPLFRWVYLKWHILFNNIHAILLKRIRHFECSDVYGATYILLKTSQIIPNFHDGRMLFNNICDIKKHRAIV